MVRGPDTGLAVGELGDGGEFGTPTREMTGEVYTWGTALDRPFPRRMVRGATRLRNLLFRDADAFVAMSREIERELHGAGMTPDKVVYGPHGVDTGRFRPATLEERTRLRQQLGWPPDAVVAVYTGRLLRGKGPETLVDAFAAVAGLSLALSLHPSINRKGTSASAAPHLRT